MKKYVIIVAGGVGRRMGGEIPKQFLPIRGKAVLMRTIERFFSYDPALHLIITLPAQSVDYWKLLCTEYNFLIPHKIVEGGQERFHSVQNALQLVPENALVAVHDGVRPFVSHELIARSFETAYAMQTAVPAIAPPESIRLVELHQSHPIDRNTVRLVQTPQCFCSSLLKKAYQHAFAEKFTDDASLVEFCCETNITLIDGERENIKLTTPFDFLVAESVLESQGK